MWCKCVLYLLPVYFLCFVRLFVFNFVKFDSHIYSDSPLDLKIKSHLVSDMFNLIGEWCLVTVREVFSHLRNIVPNVFFCQNLNSLKTSLACQTAPNSVTYLLCYTTRAPIGLENSCHLSTNQIQGLNECWWLAWFFSPWLAAVVTLLALLDCTIVVVYSWSSAFFLSLLLHSKLFVCRFYSSWSNGS